ncbi:MAG: hypothetical protein K6F51_14565 [Acetatifactor sp.]|nr:hypothetical protein [Acetatifactor sp.]
MRPGIGEKKKIFSVILAALVLCSVVFMLFFVAHEAQHACHGEDCEICFCMEICEGIVSNMKHENLGECLFALLAGLVLFKVVAIAGVMGITTPVSRKVRLNI